MATEPHAGEKLDNPDSTEQQAPEVDPYWANQQASDLRERSFHAALHPTLATTLAARSVDEVIADAVKIHKFISGAE